MYTSECKAGAHEVRGTLSLLFDDCSGGVPCSIVPRGSWESRAIRGECSMYYNDVECWDSSAKKNKPVLPCSSQFGANRFVTRPSLFKPSLREHESMRELCPHKLFAAHGKISYRIPSYPWFYFACFFAVNAFRSFALKSREGRAMHQEPTSIAS